MCKWTKWIIAKWNCGSTRFFLCFVFTFVLCVFFLPCVFILFVCLLCGSFVLLLVFFACFVLFLFLFSLLCVCVFLCCFFDFMEIKHYVVAYLFLIWLRFIHFTSTFLITIFCWFFGILEVYFKYDKVALYLLPIFGHHFDHRFTLWRN